MSVLRRLYNVAYGRVRIWREGSSEPELDPMELRQTAAREPERLTEPVEESPTPSEPVEPRQRRL